MSISHQLFSSLAVVALAAGATGCLSDEEIEARQQWAYDLSGEWQEERADGVAAGTVAIENEEGKHDIVVRFERGDLYEGESALLDRVASEEERTALATELLLGEGDTPLTDRFVGGENISDDFGESSKLRVTSARFEAEPQQADATEAVVWYALDASIANGSAELRGSLVVHFQERRPDGEGDDELHDERESFDLTLLRSAGPIDAEVCDDCTGPDGDPDLTEDEADADADADA